MRYILGSVSLTTSEPFPEGTLPCKCISLIQAFTTTLSAVVIALFC